MTEQFFDPFSLWRNVIGQMQKRANEFAGENMQSEEFARTIAQLMEASVAGKKMTQALMKKYFEMFDLPSRSDVQALDERLQAIEDQLINLTTALNQPFAGISATTTSVSTVPTRTRKPPLSGPVSLECTPTAAPVGRGGALGMESNR
jgi:hypothetical protein